ncbi:hypothetical protein, unknown function [Leishmania mexicana MHOM/GT/2001/U1103]|uniref:Uncharacterized protein n=1 Tax=Leishmania mexicana (strain MHOM/GT/2001/U1103) TaxID=929439 RepID=E9AVL7_LEIMU|nr:hypothetical protein, unknown function [Leishmania mexicana MHOM/GT/2001/U1103]CBZ27000.1 hypothetical protein, unknown function [Leishmania mexicana MHOM/GT/2001/U1103]
MDSTRNSTQCGATFVEVSAVASEGAAPDAHRQGKGCLTPSHIHCALPRLSAASVSTVASVASLGDDVPASVVAKLTPLYSCPLPLAKAYPTTESASSMPSSCGATTETENRFGDAQSHAAATPLVPPVLKSSSSLHSSLPSASAIAVGSARRLTPNSTSSMDGAWTRSRNVDGPRTMSLRLSTTSPHTLHGSVSFPVPGEESVPLVEMDSHVESNRTTPLAETFLTQVPLPQEDVTASSSQPSSPIAVDRTAVPCTVMHTSSNAVEAQRTASPVVPTRGSPIGFATATAMRCTPQRRSRSFDMPLPIASGVTGGSCDDLSRCYAERRELSTITASIRTSEHFNERLGDAHRPPPFIYPSEPTAAFSTLKASVVGVAVPAAAHSNNNSGGGVATFSSNTSTNGGDAEAQVGTGIGLRRTISCDTLASVSSSRSRPVLTPAAVGPPEASGAASGTASTTMTSVTYTRRNVCLGALDFHGNPVTSLSSLLVQMSLRSGDHEEADPSEARLGAASPYPLTQQPQQRNTLSMQNLMVHTQQVGQMAPEDKVKRFHAKPDGGAIAMYRATGTTIPRRLRTCTKPCSTTSAASASGAPPAGTAAAASAQQQVGSLKDVLQDCNFLSLKDVLSAIADTHVNELREAQQRLSNTHAGGSDGKSTDGRVASTAPASVVVNALSACVASMPLKAEEFSAAASTFSGGIQPSVTCRLGGAGSEWACTSSAREGDSGVCLSTSPSTDATCISALHPSVSSLDAQQVLTLAAAITEASLNLDRSAEASFGGSTTAAAVSASFPTLLGETVPAGSVALPPSAIATPTRVQSAVLSGSLISSTHADASRGVASTSAASTDGVSEAFDYRCDPLEHKVLLLQPSSDGVDGVARSGMWECPGGRSLLSPSPLALKVTAAASPVIVTSSAPKRFAAAGSPYLRQCGGRYVANWRGLSSGEEVPGKTAVPGTTIAVNADPPPMLPRLAETMMSADCGMCASSRVGKQEGAGVSTVTCDSTPVTRASITAGDTLPIVGDGCVMVESIPFRSFNDELHNVSQLRHWARSIARLEHLQPSTETEVIT